MLKGQHGYHYQGELAHVSTVPLVEKRLVNSDHPPIADIHEELCSIPNH